MSIFINKLLTIKASMTFDDVLIKPRMSSVLPADTDISVKLNDNLTLDIPVLSAAMDTITEFEMADTMMELGACGPLHKNCSAATLISHIKKLSSKHTTTKACAVAIGVNTSKEDIQSFVSAGANVMVVDSAHGHSENVGVMVEYLKNTYPHLFIIAGNVVTAEGAEFLIQKGAHAVKVGIGPGSICITRKVTGIGVGQLSAISEVATVCKQHGVLTIADGGIRSVDEIIKAIVVGADLVMLGYMIAGSDECPGETVSFNDEQYKAYRGMGCVNAMKQGSAERYNKTGLPQHKWIPEGIECYVKYKGSVKNIMHNIVWGIKTSLGYLGSKTILEAQNNAELVQITNSVLKKSDIHSIDKISSSKID